MVDWFLRIFKGMLIGSGFILPGISGGALAAIFGIYEPLIHFLAHPFKKFKANFCYFLPVGIGGVLGVFFLSFGVSFFLGKYETPILWFFVGAIVGTLPSLWKQAGSRGRSKQDYWIAGITFIVSLVFLLTGQKFFNMNLPQNFATWMFAGGLIGLGTIVPGLSPSNFLLYIGMYKAMSDGIKTGNLGVIIPLTLGLLIVLATLSKIFDKLFQVAYQQLFHFIIGIVIASTVVIIPVNYSGLGFIGIASCCVLFILGTALGLWMSRLEEKFK